MTANLVWSIILAAVGILGLYLAGSKKTLGWLVSLGAQVLWIIFALVSKQYGFILSALAYSWVYGRNFFKWRREQEEPNDASPH